MNPSLPTAHAPDLGGAAHDPWITPHRSRFTYFANFVVQESRTTSTSFVYM
jgi:hypothetical protein